LQFEISDNGYGMSKKFQKHMFESFATEKNRSSAKEGGTGLGLSIVKNLTELMGGTVECNSTLNVGTTFVLKLPLKVISKEEFESAGTNFELQNFDGLQGKHILICEDNYLNTVIVKKILEKRGMITDTASNGKIGVEKALNNEYDAILMDIRMPVMGGLEAASKIREFNATIPIIALSANAYKEDINNSLEVGMNMHLVKPIEIDKLFTVLINLIKS
jgi:CheY-like chemotaxis protein